MPYFDYDGSVDIDVDDFLSACSSREINDLIDALEEDGYIKSSQRLTDDPTVSASEQLFEEALNKLHGKWNQLSNSEEEIILTITKRF